MEELKMLVEMVADLPNAALWVIAALFAYKVCIVGSIYGVIRLAIVKAHDYLTTPKHELRKVTVEMEGTLRGLAITADADALLSQITRLRGKRVQGGSAYIHGCSVEWLRQAIDEKEAQDALTAKPKAVANA